MRENGHNAIINNTVMIHFINLTAINEGKKKIIVRAERCGEYAALT